jgi:hypothetical protein
LRVHGDVDRTQNGTLPLEERRVGRPDLLAAALAYRGRGWSVIPTIDKRHPRFAWKRFQREPPSEALVTDWFTRFGDVSGVAVLCGPVSGDLACRDYDDPLAYDRWAGAHPALARKLPTVRTKRGYHVWLRGPQGYEDCGDGEYWGDPRHYCMLPPSPLPQGGRYEWLVPLPEGELPFLDPSEVGLIGTDEVVCNTEDSRGLRGSKGVSDPSALSVLHDATSAGPAGDAILASLPSGAGQRHRALFALARRLKALPHLADADLACLRPLVRRWHELALPVIRTKPFEESWVDFAEGWRLVKLPAGAGPLEALWAEALAAPLPPAAMGYGDEGVRRLVAFCYRLQRHAGRSPFFLACRTAGALLGTNHVAAWRWLRLLEIDGVLARVSTGSRAKRRANEYRYVAGRMG